MFCTGFLYSEENFKPFVKIDKVLVNNIETNKRPLTISKNDKITFIYHVELPKSIKRDKVLYKVTIDNSFDKFSNDRWDSHKASYFDLKEDNYYLVF